MTGKKIHIREAGEADVPLILSLIHAIAEYEKLPHEVEATEELLDRYLFGTRPAAEVILAFSYGQPAGYALFFQTFSTFVGKPGLYLEDLFVQPDLRGRGIGRAMLCNLASLALQRGYGRVEWSVLDWNESAIGFYRRLGARPMDGWTTYRLTGAALEAAARDGSQNCVG